MFTKIKKKLKLELRKSDFRNFKTKGNEQEQGRKLPK